MGRLLIALRRQAGSVVPLNHIIFKMREGRSMKKLQLCLVCFSLLVLGAVAQVQNGPAPFPDSVEVYLNKNGSGRPYSDAPSRRFGILRRHCVGCGALEGERQRHRRDLGGPSAADLGFGPGHLTRPEEPQPRTGDEAASIHLL